ncbi:MAG TPA: DUF3443 family protein [Caldimonas sp.]|nr:DUF3443 family protein [Caldimonas sp.]
MRFADIGHVAAVALAVLLAACGGSSSETTLVGSGVPQGSGAGTVVLDEPSGPNTTEVLVDNGPGGGFSLGAANIPYVSVTVCEPGSAVACVTIDHVFLDTGSIGLRVLKSAVRTLALPALQVAADAAHATPAGAALECYPFVLGAVWGPMATADVRVAQELAPSLPIQLIDDGAAPDVAPTSDCLAAANGQLQNSVAALQANGILGIGMLSFDCGLPCTTADYAGGHVIYWSCPAGAACAPAAVPIAGQMQNPVPHFAVDNNGSVILLPALPDLGATVAKGRLVFGIGTQANNQLAAGATVYRVNADPSSADYLYWSTQVGSTTYPWSYVDSGSNALFFDDASLPRQCQSSTGSTAGWYCPGTLVRRTATITDAQGNSGTVDFAVANADALFGSSSIAFADLAGTTGAGSASFAWGLPLFYGRTVYTAIWGQALALDGPWNAF